MATAIKRTFQAIQNSLTNTVQYQESKILLCKELVIA